MLVLLCPAYASNVTNFTACSQLSLTTIDDQPPNEQVSSLQQLIDCFYHAKTPSITSAEACSLHRRLVNLLIIRSRKEEAQQYARKGAQLARNRFGLGSEEHLRMYASLAYVLENSGRYTEAAAIRESITLMANTDRSRNTSSSVESKNRLLFSNLFRLGELKSRLGKGDDLDYWYNKASQLNVEDSELELNGVLMWANAYKNHNRYAKAKEILIQFIDRASIGNRLNNATPRLWFYVYLLATEIEVGLARATDVTQAIQFLRRAKTIFDPGIDNLDAIYLCKVEATLRIAQGRFGQAQIMVDKALLYTRQLNTQTFHSANADVYTHLYLTGMKNQFAAFQHSQHPEVLAKALEFGRLGIAQLDQYLQQFIDQEDLVFNLYQFFELYEGMASILQLYYSKTANLKYLKEALTILSKTKNLQLRSSFNRSFAANDLKIPSSYLLEEKELRQEVFSLEKSLDQANFLSEIEANEAKVRLLDKQEKLSALHSQMTKEYPSLTSIMQETDPVHWRGLKNKLAKTNQTLLHYTVGREAIYLIAASAKGNDFVRIPLGIDTLMHWRKRLKEALFVQPYEPTKKHQQTVAHLSHQLYSSMIAPVEHVLTERLLVIPDGPLEAIPFAMLLRAEPDGLDAMNYWPYLIRNHSINYTYGLDLWLKENEKESNRPMYKQVLAFAPSFGGGWFKELMNHFKPENELRYNGQEVQYLNRYFETNAFYGEAAQLTPFRQLVSDYSAVHLATHAVANEEKGTYSYLLFSNNDSLDSQLEVEEIYTMDIPAELVVLSACETGQGEWKLGEGTIGLERAFTFAGAKSIVTTYWSISDRASVSLMQGFYSQLADGLPKDIALQRAQLQFMDTNPGWLAHPFYWAAFVQKGSIKPVHLNLRKSRFSFLFLLILVVGIGLFGWQVRQHSKYASQY